MRRRLKSCLQAKEYHGFLAPEARRRARNRFSSRAFRESMARGHLDVGLLGSRTEREYISLILSHPVVVLCEGRYGKLTQGRRQVSGRAGYPDGDGRAGAWHMCSGISSLRICWYVRLWCQIIASLGPVWKWREKPGEGSS